MDDDGASDLTLARNAIWDAIDNWPELDGTFNKKFRFRQGDKSLNRTVGFGDLNAIAIWTDSFSEEYAFSIETKWPVTYRISVWTRDWELDMAEDIVTKISRALWKSKPVGDPVSYLQRACGGLTPQLKVSDFRRIRLGQSDMTDQQQRDERPVTLTEMQLVLRTRRNPLEEKE